MSTLRLKTQRSVPREQFELFAFVSVHSIEGITYFRYSPQNNSESQFKFVCKGDYIEKTNNASLRIEAHT